MILTVDIGNTNIVIGCLNDKKTFFIERFSTDRRKTTLEYAIALKSLLEIYAIRPEMIRGSIISSVVPQVTDIFHQAIKDIIGKEAIIIGPGIKTGLNILIDNPAQLGADLLSVSIAAADLYPLPNIVIDMGTATTMTVVNEKKQYIGGMIIPGVRTSLDSLVEKTSLLQQISLDKPKKVIGTDTVSCMKSGLMYGTAVMIDGLIDKIEEELGQKCSVVATGGLSETVVSLCSHDIIYNENLLLHGMKLIYDKNCKEKVREV